VGGSQWFDASEEDMYDVYNHHLVEAPSEAAIFSPTSLGSHSQRSETATVDQPSLPAFNPTPLGIHSQRSETAIELPSTAFNPTPLGTHSQRSETVIEDQPCRFLCRYPLCDGAFPSRNRLHKHLWEERHYSTPVISIATGAKVVKPTKQPSLGTGYAFRGYRYAEMQIRPTIHGEDQWICADSGCGMTVVDEQWFRATFPAAHIAAMPIPVRIKGISSDSHVSQLYSVVTIFVPSLSKGEPVLVELSLEMHLVQGLTCHMLIGVDMLKPYGISLDFNTSLLRIPSCDASSPIRTRSLEDPIRRRVQVKERTVVPPYSRFAVPISFKPFTHDRDVNFLPKYSQNMAYVAHSGAFLESLCSNTTCAMLYHNKTDRPVIFPQNTKVGEMVDFSEDSQCLFLDANTAPTVIADPFAAAERHAPSFEAPSAATGLHLSAEAFMGIGDRVPKTTAEKVSDAMGESILDDLGTPDIGSSIHDIKYGPDLTPDQLAQLKRIVEKHRAIWEKLDGVVDEPPEKWLKIKLKKNANLKSRGVYRLGTKDRAVVDELFDKLIADGKMSKCTEPNPVGWGVFLVRTGRPGDKGRVVIDTRGLKAAAEDDAYPLPRQEDVMSTIRWCLYIALCDQIKSYYQRVLHPESRPFTAVVTHRGHEFFNVALLGYKGSPAHQQKFVDDFLEEFREWASSYIDDIVVGSRTFKEHLDHLGRLFAKMELAKLALNPKKCYLGFQRIQLLGHIVDRFGIYTLEAKTAAIRTMDFPATLADLEYFLGLTGYYRQFVPFYSLRAAPLRKLSTELAKLIRKSDQRRSAKSDTVRVPPPTKEQIESFEQLKGALSSEQFLIHDDSSVPLMLAIDASYEYGFGVAVYQVPRATMEECNMSVEDVQKGGYDRRRDRVVMFLSKELTSAETLYWPTELETSALVFAVKKTRHLVEANDFPTIVYTDHVAVKHIAHSTSLKTSSPERANMRLIRGSQYLSQFRLDVRYVPGKDNVVADALSRIKRVPTKVDIFTVVSDIIPDQNRPGNSQSYIHMSPEFVEKWSTSLRGDKHYRTIFAELMDKIGDADEVESYGWVLRKYEGQLVLFVRKGDQGGLRACIPAEYAQTVIKAAHDAQAHPGIEATFANIRDHFYMPRMSTTVRSYVSACPECAKK
jgi:hypothetical protein